MYLALLNKEQKECFLGLAYNIANIDGNYSDSEQQLIESYCAEMDIEYLDSIAKKDFNSLLSNITSLFDNKTIRIVIFELIGLAMIDDNFDEPEHKFINSIIDMFTVESDFINKSENLIKSYLALQFSINTLILK